MTYFSSVARILRRTPAPFSRAGLFGTCGASGAEVSQRSHDLTRQAARSPRSRGSCAGGLRNPLAPEAMGFSIVGWYLRWRIIRNHGFLNGGTT